MKKERKYLKAFMGAYDILKRTERVRDIGMIILKLAYSLAMGDTVNPYLQKLPPLSGRLIVNAEALEL